MRLPRLAAREARALRLAAFFLAPALTYSLLLRPYATARAALRAEVAQERDLLQREQSLLLGQADTQQQMDEVARRLDSLRPMLFEGRDPSAQSSAMAAHVRELALEARVRISDLRVPVADSAREGLQVLVVELRGLSDLEGIASLLRELERGQRLISVKRLVLARAIGPQHNDEDTEAIEVGLQLEGLAGTASDPDTPLMTTASVEKAAP